MFESNPTWLTPHSNSALTNPLAGVGRGSGERGGGVEIFRVDRKTVGFFSHNHNYNKIVKSDWLSTALISALIGQFNRTVRVMPK